MGWGIITEAWSIERSAEREEGGIDVYPSLINELSQKVDGVVTSASVVPTGLWVSGASVPSDESLGYYHKSLRDRVSA